MFIHKSCGCCPCVSIIQQSQYHSFSATTPPGGQPTKRPPNNIPPFSAQASVSKIPSTRNPTELIVTGRTSPSPTSMSTEHDAASKAGVKEMGDKMDPATFLQLSNAATRAQEKRASSGKKRQRHDEKSGDDGGQQREEGNETTNTAER